MGITEWKIAELDKEKSLYMMKKWNIPFFLSVLLNVRHLTDKAEADKFLNGYNEFSSPFDFIDMDKLVQRMEKAIKSSEKICVYGDYDADGVTSTALVYSYLKSRGADVTYYIPKREEDGYGLNVQVIDRLKESGINLIITVDNGISAYKEVAYAKSIGMDCVITDHHRPPEIIPEAAAIVNPYRKDCPSKFKYFSGVGVAFKAVQAMETNKSTLEELIEEYADLVTIGTIGDFIELTGETRDMVRSGLKVIAKAKRPGIRAILQCMGLYGKEVDASNVVFGIVPKINVSGRMEDAEQAVKLLVADNIDDALALFSEVDVKNEQRKMVENEIYNHINEKLKNEPWRKYEKIIVLEGEKWHQGVLGIVASKLMKKYGKPCVLITYDGEDAKGSCRSVEGFSIHEAISACSEHLERFGGHPMAAGINLKTKNIGAFSKALLDYVNSVEEMPFPAVYLDCKLNPSTLSAGMVKQLNMLKPFGSGNPEPIFGIYSLALKKINPIGRGRHLKLTLAREATTIDALYFGHTILDFPYKTGETLDLAVTIHKNDFPYSDGISLYISDIKLSASDPLRILTGKRMYENFKSQKSLSLAELKELIPSREQVGMLYRYLVSHQGTWQRADIIVSRIGHTLIDSQKVYITLDIIQELGLAQIEFDADKFCVTIIPSDEKVDLDSAPILQEIRNRIEKLEKSQ